MQLQFYNTSELLIGVNIVAIIAMLILIKAEDTYSETSDFNDELFTSNLLGDKDFNIEH